MKLPASIARWFGGDPVRDAAEALYAATCAQARRPEPFSELGVPDSLDGRFDALCMHMFLVVRRLSREGDRGAGLAHGLYDSMFADMDRTLREMGVGDLGVGKRVKEMVTAFYGRVDAYQNGLAGGPAALAEALSRNLYRGEPPAPERLAAMAAYVAASSSALSALGRETLARGEVAFADLPAA